MTVLLKYDVAMHPVLCSLVRFRSQYGMVLSTDKNRSRTVALRDFLSGYIVQLRGLFWDVGNWFRCDIARRPRCKGSCAEQGSRYAMLGILLCCSRLNCLISSTEVH